jgi:hypothetical protein
MCVVRLLLVVAWQHSCGLLAPAIGALLTPRRTTAAPEVSLALALCLKAYNHRSLFEELVSKDECLNMVMLILLEGGRLLCVAPVVPRGLAP